MTDTITLPASQGMTAMGDTKKSLYWRCGGCDRLFKPNTLEKRRLHAKNEHGASSAVTFHAVSKRSVECSACGTPRHSDRYEDQWIKSENGEACPTCGSYLDGSPPSDR